MYMKVTERIPSHPVADQQGFRQVEQGEGAGFQIPIAQPKHSARPAQGYSGMSRRDPDDCEEKTEFSVSFDVKSRVRFSGFGGGKLLPGPIRGIDRGGTDRHSTLFEADNFLKEKSM
jgi:hypothetical protein